MESLLYVRIGGSPCQALWSGQPHGNPPPPGLIGLVQHWGIEQLSTASFHSPAQQKSGDSPPSKDLRSKSQPQLESLVSRLSLLKPTILLSVWKTVETLINLMGRRVPGKEKIIPIVEWHHGLMKRA